MTGTRVSSPEFSGTRYDELSFWHSTAGESLVQRPSLDHSTDVDVCIVGAGFTGLWTAYYLARKDPSLRIAVLEKHIAGFGASGRNGGSVSGARYAMSLDRLAQESSREAALAQYRALDAAFDAIENVIRTESIDCDWARGGSVAMARTPLQLQAARAGVANRRTWGLDDDILLDKAEMEQHVRASNVLGGTLTPRAASVHPSKLVRGLSRVVERLGVPIYEGSPALRLGEGAVETPGGTVRADVVVRALEGYTALLPGFKRALTPLYSMMLATEPLDEETWAQIGLRNRESFGDYRHLIIYGQRTADNRFAFGGRGAPYYFGSDISRRHETHQKFFPKLRESLIELFPQVESAQITHMWGGVFSSARDWHPSVGLDERAKLAWAGGYAGSGVTAANLAGQSLSDLILKRDTDLTRLPWTNHRSPHWEVEPLRWIGINAALHAMAGVDRKEARTGKPTTRARVVGRLMGH